jgi:hypothetical protein
MLPQRDGTYYITESHLTGQPQEHRVDYTLGNRRIQKRASSVGMGVTRLAGADGRCEAAKALYQARADLSAGDAIIQLGAGRFYLLAGDPARAIGALETSLKLVRDTFAEYLLAYAHAERAEYSTAREILQNIAPAGPQYPKTLELLKALEGR